MVHQGVLQHLARHGHVDLLLDELALLLHDRLAGYDAEALLADEVVVGAGLLRHMVVGVRLLGYPVEDVSPDEVAVADQDARQPGEVELRALEAEPDPLVDVAVVYEDHHAAVRVVGE